MPEVGHEADPALVELVTEVTNRFGVEGLDQLVALAQARRAEVVATLDSLAVPESGSSE